MIEANPLDIEIKLAYGKTMSQLEEKFAINGTFFDTPNPALSKSVWQIAINNGITLGENAFTNNYSGVRKGTMVCFEDGRVIMDRFNNVSEISKLGKIKWAIGGNAAYPDYNLKIERAASDISRVAPHTLLAYTKDKKVLLLITKMNKHLDNVVADLRSIFNLYSAINLDGGGSTSMKADGAVIKDQGRKLNNIIAVKQA